MNTPMNDTKHIFLYACAECHFTTALPGIEGETLVIELDNAGFAVASGAACSSTSTEPSATLLAMGVAPEVARGAVRLSLGAANTPADIESFTRALGKVLAKLKSLTAVAV